MTRAFLVLGTVALAGGLFMPSVTVTPTLGDPVLDFFGPMVGFDPTPNTYSLLDGIIKLYKKGSWHIALLLFVFTALTPTFKQFCLWWRWSGLVRRDLWAWRTMDAAAHYSFLDVWVVGAVLVAYLPIDGVHIELGPGLFLFALSVLLGMVVARSLTPGCREAADRRG